MLVNFAIDPSVLTEDLPQHVLERLRRTWLDKRLCVLIEPKWKDGSIDRSPLLEAISSINDQGLRQKVEDMYKTGRDKNLIRTVTVSRPVATPYEPNIVNALSPFIDVLVSGEDHRQRFEYNLTQRADERILLTFPTKGPKEIEVVTLEGFDLALKVIEAEALRSGTLVQGGSDMDKVWQQSFRDEFQVAKTVHLVDRYILSQERPGLEKFIELAKRHTPAGVRSKVLTIYSTPALNGSDNTTQKAAATAYRRVRNHLTTTESSPHPFHEVTVKLVKTNAFIRTTGGRHMRFHDIVIVAPDHGAEVFEGTRAIQINTHLDIDGFRGLERTLSKFVLEEKTITI